MTDHKRQPPTRERLPNDRLSDTHKFSVGKVDGYAITGMYDDGRLGELFVYISKEGSSLSGMLRAWSISVSVGLQYGIPLSVFAKKFRHMKFEPAGVTENEGITFASSVLDYIFAWLEIDFPDGAASEAVILRARQVAAQRNAEFEREVKEDPARFIFLDEVKR